MSRLRNRSRPTLLDVARKAGVSSASVSYVLNGTGSVGPEVKKAVHAAVKSIRYRVNHVAKATRTGQTQSIGLILPDLNNPFFPEMAKVVQAAARRAGYAVLLIDSEGEIDVEREGAEDLISRGVDGIVWFPASEQDSLAEVRDYLPIVVVDRPLPNYDTISSDYRAGGASLAEQAASLGHRRIGLISGPESLSSARERRNGFIEALTNEQRIVWEVENPFSIDLVPFARQRVVDGGVSVIICGNDLIAIGVMRALHEAGQTVPDSVSVVGFDDIPWSRFSVPGLATIRQPFLALGEEAARLLVRRISGDDAPKISVSLKMSLRPRGSLQQAPESSES